MKWKNLGFVPDGWDESRMIKYGDTGFLYLSRLLRDDWRQFRGYTIKDRRWRPGQGGCNASYDWTGLNEAIAKTGTNLQPPPVALSVKPRQLSPDERESLGREAHRNWMAVRKQQRAAGQVVPDEELREWKELSEDLKELFRRSAESLALPEYLMWDAVAEMRRKMGEKAFRKKMFEVSVSVAFERMLPSWSEAERFRATHVIVGLSEMLEVPPTPWRPMAAQLCRTPALAVRLEPLG
jgi:hypothetical protein